MKLPRILEKRTIMIIIILLFGVLVVTAWYFFSQNSSTSDQYSPAITGSFDVGGTDESLIENLISTDSESLDQSDIYSQIDNSQEQEENSNQSIQSQTPITAPSWYAYPDTILPCTRSGNDLLVLVNKQYQLPAAYTPGDLVPIENSGIRVTTSGLSVRNIIVTDLTALVSVAKGQGIDIAALSAYRSYDSQQIAYNYWVSYNGGSTDAADQISARPGHSQHQLGTTVDFTTNEISDQLGQHFGPTAAGLWLAEHAWEYGFSLGYPSGWESVTGYSYEPWHYRYIGKENAAEWHASGKILETWLQEKN